MAQSKTAQPSRKRETGKKQPSSRSKSSAAQRATKGSSSSDAARTSSSRSGSKQGSSSKRTSAPRAAAPRRSRPVDIARTAVDQLVELTGQEVEGVTGLERSDEGWTVQVQAVEVQRIPNTTDVLAVYEIDADEDGGLLGYRRLRRFTRGAPGEE